MSDEIPVKKRYCLVCNEITVWVINYFQIEVCKKCERPAQEVADNYGF
jgi:hypothetical protein